MTAAFQAAGAITGTSAGSPISPAWPTHVAGDIAFLVVMTNHSSLITPSLTTANGFAAVTGTNATDAVNMTMRVWFCIATSSAMSAPVVASNLANGTVARIYTYRGGQTTGTPYDAASNGASNSSASYSVTSPTTTGANRFVVAFAASNSGTSYSAWANTSLTGVAENSDTTDSLNTGFQMAAASGTKAAAGAVNNFTATISATTNYVGATVAIADVAAATSTSNNLLLLGVG